MKKILVAILKLLALAMVTASLIWLLNLTVTGIAVTSYKEGIRQGYNACQKQTGIPLEKDKERKIEDWTS